MSVCPSSITSLFLHRYLPNLIVVPLNSVRLISTFCKALKSYKNRGVGWVWCDCDGKSRSEPGNKSEINQLTAGSSQLLVKSRKPHLVFWYYFYRRLFLFTKNYFETIETDQNWFFFKKIRFCLLLRFYNMFSQYIESHSGC